MPIDLRRMLVRFLPATVLSLVVFVAGCGVFGGDAATGTEAPEREPSRAGEPDGPTGGSPGAAPESRERRDQNAADGQIIGAAPASDARASGVPVSAAQQGATINPPAANPSKPKLTIQQVRSRLRSFADQYRNEIASACDEIKANREDPRLRRLAHQYKLDGTTAVYDIAVEENARQAVLDMLVLVTLQWYAAESHAERQFPQDHELIRERARIIKDSAWTLAAQVLSEKQRTDLLSIIDQWWTANGSQTEIWYVRITDFAGYGKGTAFEGVFGGVTNLPGKFLNVFVPIDDATDSLNEASNTAERAVWLTPRLMILAQWRAEAIVLDSLATTEVSGLIRSTNEAVRVADRATSVAETLPAELGAQREALIRDLVENEESLKALLDETRATIESIRTVTADANSIAVEGQALLEATESALGTADTVVRSVESMIATAQQGGSDGDDAGGSEESPGRPFDITEYTEALRSAEAALAEVNAALAKMETATEPDELARRLEPALGLSEGFIDDTLGRVERLVIVSAAALALAGIAIIAFAKFVPARRPS